MDKSTESEAAILRKGRIELGMTQMDVALNAGLQLQHYQNYEYAPDSCRRPQQFWCYASALCWNSIPMR